jgi:hypothetical protein
MELIQKEIPMEHETNEKMWIYKDNKGLFNKFSQIPIEEIKPKSSILITSIQTQPQIQTKIKKETPLELIIKYTSTTDKMKQEIKNRLIEFIGIPEFAKAFGVKKSAEVVSAITRDTWNQSTALFISFLLDSNIVYKEKSYLFNKNKNTKEIILG